MSPLLPDLQERLGYRFRDPALLVEALTHPSYLQDDPETTQSNHDSSSSAMPCCTCC